MPIRTFDGEFIDIPLSNCFGKRCDDGRFHVILQNGTHGIWITKDEQRAEEEERKHRDSVLRDQPVRKIKL